MKWIITAAGVALFVCSIAPRESGLAATSALATFSKANDARPPAGSAPLRRAQADNNARVAQDSALPAAVNDAAQIAFDRARTTNTIAAWDAFLVLFGDTPLARRALEERQKLVQLAWPTGSPRAVLYEEDPADPIGAKYEGAVAWASDDATQSGPAVRGEMTIPARKLTASLTIRRNTDAKLPASHTIEIRFTIPPEFPHGGVANIPGMLMKQMESTRGAPLLGLAVKVTTNSFLIGLSSVEPTMRQNIQMLRERSWFDIPIVYNDGKRAILAVEKGQQGEMIFSDAMAEWSKSDPSPRP